MVERSLFILLKLVACSSSCENSGKNILSSIPGFVCPPSVSPGHLSLALNPLPPPAMSVLGCHRAKEEMWDFLRKPGCILHGSLIGQPMPGRLCFCRHLQRRVPSSLGGSEGEALESECRFEHWTAGKVTPRDTGLVPSPAAGSLNLDPNPGYLVLLQATSCPSLRRWRRAVVTGMALELSPRGRSGAMFHNWPAKSIYLESLSHSILEHHPQMPVHSTP